MTTKPTAKSRLFEAGIERLELSRQRPYRVLDLGCGSGEFLSLLSRSVGPGSRLVGMDAMEKSIARARAGCSPGEFVCARFVEALPFADAAFDVVVTVDTLECIANKRAAVEEMYRVLKPGGQVLAMHWDWDTQTYNIPSRELARRAVWAFSDWKQPWMDEADGQMGRKLWGLFEGSGRFHGVPGTFCLLETEYEAGGYGYDRARDLGELVEQGGFDRSEYQRFCRELAESSLKGEYLYGVLSFIYHGTRC